MPGRLQVHVHPAHRGRGAGGRLAAALAAEARDRAPPGVVVAVPAAGPGTPSARGAASPASARCTICCCRCASRAPACWRTWPPPSIPATGRPAGSRRPAAPSPGTCC
ncbi:GNAT family N-acetyltransferase [Actinomadura parmotrematis]|uniref:GNAT family N-acetyltransferase n=1 Tax=Actinomadura parmotrematis TaxID=2864039 RepID=UPI003558FD79